MKIAHVNLAWHTLHRRFGGGEMALLRTATITRDQGHDVFLVTLKPNVEQPHCEFRYYALRRWEDYLPRLVARYLEPVKWYVWQRDALASGGFEKIMRVERPDVVHFHNFQFMGLDLLRIARAHGARICYTVYDYWMFCPNVMLLNGRDEYCRRFHGPYCVDCLPREFRLVQKALLARRKKVFDRYLALVDRWIVLSNHSAGILRDYGIADERIRLVRLTLPVNFSDAGAASAEGVDPNMIFFAGWLQKRKGVHVLLEAMPIILQQCPDAVLHVGGGHTKFDREYKRTIERLMAREGMAEHVKFPGHLPPAEVEARLRRCAVVAIPEQYENMSPLLMIEAMALAKPLVISRAGGIPEYVEDGVSGWLADPRSPAEFAEKIVQVLKNPEQARDMGRRARERVQVLCEHERIVRDSMAAYAF
ncbi:MAG: glycosyltransferase family 4 protein [Kiritimatiellae bacterium]|nr:glycosyltransferase family 4 protein [Kiritimatiellia bacterium]